ncbi:hypothetical protein FRB95_003494 [Tulasnella sp. JGI-2019a]|nr:hypothetical protein FRB95_003494 [Tulasnella sp. JGI-2019a]
MFFMPTPVIVLLINAITALSRPMGNSTDLSLVRRGGEISMFRQPQPAIERVARGIYTPKELGFVTKYAKLENAEFVVDARSALDALVLALAQAVQEGVEDEDDLKILRDGAKLMWVTSRTYAEVVKAMREKPCYILHRVGWKTINSRSAGECAR